MSTASLHDKPTEQFINAGLGAGLVFALFGAAAVGRLPFAVSWLIETVVFTGAFAGVTLHKRNRWGWAWTGYVAAVCLTDVFAYVTGLSVSHAGGGLSWAAGALIAVGWLCVLKLERHRKPVQPPVQQTVNHVVFHGLPDGFQLPGARTPDEVTWAPGLPGDLGSPAGIAAGPRPLAITAPREQDSLARRLAGKTPAGRILRRR